MSSQSETAILSALYERICARKSADPAASYTARLLADAPALPTRKLGEEAVETIIAALAEDNAALAEEAADLLYHLLVVLAARGVSLSEVLAVLERRAEQGDG